MGTRCVTKRRCHRIGTGWTSTLAATLLSSHPRLQCSLLWAPESQNSAVHVSHRPYLPSSTSPGGKHFAGEKPSRVHRAPGPLPHVPRLCTSPVPGWAQGRPWPLTPGSKEKQNKELVIKDNMDLTREGRRCQPHIFKNYFSTSNSQNNFFLQYHKMPREIQDFSEAEWFIWRDHADPKSIWTPSHPLLSLLSCPLPPHLIYSSLPHLVPLHCLSPSSLLPPAHPPLSLPALPFPPSGIPSLPFQRMPPLTPFSPPALFYNYLPHFGW